MEEEEDTHYVTLFSCRQGTSFRKGEGSEEVEGGEVMIRWRKTYTVTVEKEERFK